MSKRLSSEEFIAKAKQLHNDKYDYSKTNYETSRIKVVIICPVHGEFEQLPSSHLQGNGCPKCARIWSDSHRINLQTSSRKSRGMTTEEWIDRVKQVHGNKYDYSQTVYVNQRTNVKIICPVHGMFEQKADSHLRGNGCRLCGLQSDGHKGVHNWTESQYEKIAKTCLEKYGATRYLDSTEGKNKVMQIKSTSEYREKLKQIISSDDIQSKTRKTCLDKYGVESPMQLPEIVNKGEQSKLRNHTWSTSKPEEIMYIKLCERFGKDDVHRQHKSLQYPFRCDFYIDSLDLYIELNATWLHGEHWFDIDNVNDIAILNQWQRKINDGHRFYEVAIDVWTVRDVKKRQTAIDNNLNYVVFWDSKLSDFKEWLEADELVLNNIY